jgi:hypothetical protein
LEHNNQLHLRTSKHYHCLLGLKCFQASERTCKCKILVRWLLRTARILGHVFQVLNGDKRCSTNCWQNTIQRCSTYCHYCNIYSPELSHHGSALYSVHCFVYKWGWHIRAYCRNPPMILTPISWIDDFFRMSLWPSKNQIINSKFSNENSKKVKSINEQRELQLDSSNNNNNNNNKICLNLLLILRKSRVLQNLYWVFMKIWDGIDFPGLS